MTITVAKSSKKSWPGDGRSRSATYRNRRLRWRSANRLAPGNPLASSYCYAGVRSSLLPPTFSLLLKCFLKHWVAFDVRHTICPFDNPNHETLMLRAHIFSLPSTPVPRRLIRIGICVRSFVYAVREKSASSGTTKVFTRDYDAWTRTCNMLRAENSRPRRQSWVRGFY